MDLESTSLRELGANAGSQALHGRPEFAPAFQQALRLPGGTLRFKRNSQM